LHLRQGQMLAGLETAAIEDQRFIAIRGGCAARSDHRSLSTHPCGGMGWGRSANQCPIHRDWGSCRFGAELAEVDRLAVHDAAGVAIAFVAGVRWRFVALRRPMLFSLREVVVKHSHQPVSTALGFSWYRANLLLSRKLGIGRLKKHETPMNWHVFEAGGGESGTRGAQTGPEVAPTDPELQAIVRACDCRSNA
jgi:hypothetical protein